MTQVGKCVKNIYIYVLIIILLGSFVLFAEPKILCEVGAEVKEDEDVAGLDCERLTFFPELNETHAFVEDQHGSVTPTPCSSAPDCPDIRVILQELHPREEVSVFAAQESAGVSRQNHRAQMPNW